MANNFDVIALEKMITDLLAHYPELQDDAELRLDMLEGSTTFTETISRLLHVVLDNNALSNATHEAILAIQDRKRRFDRRVEFNRELILRLMEAGDIRKLELPLATVSVSRKPASVVITDEEKIPEEFFRIKKEPNKTKIKEALTANVEVEGASLSNGGSTLIIR